MVHSLPLCRRAVIAVLTFIASIAVVLAVLFMCEVVAVDAEHCAAVTILVVELGGVRRRRVRRGRHTRV